MHRSLQLRESWFISHDAVTRHKTGLSSWASEDLPKILLSPRDAKFKNRGYFLRTPRTLLLFWFAISRGQ